MSGEELHKIGRDGAIRAKDWLERTTRVDVKWINPGLVEKLEFQWTDGTKFSFDLGGCLRSGEFHGQEFYAEVKKYSTVGNQPGEYEEYLAKCYRAFSLLPARCDHFFWITWHPFSQTKWQRLCGPDEVESAVKAHSAKCLGDSSLSREMCETVADRLWLIVLSDRQEELTIEEADLDHVIALQRSRNR